MTALAILAAGCSLVVTNLGRLSLKVESVPMSDARPPLPVLDFDRIGPRVGERFPDLLLPNQTGESVDLHARRDGRQALVLFHRSASW